MSICKDIAVLRENYTASEACVNGLVVVILIASGLFAVAEVIVVVVVASVAALICVNVNLNQYDSIVYCGIKLFGGIGSVGSRRNNIGGENLIGAAAALGLAYCVKSGGNVAVL